MGFLPQPSHQLPNPESPLFLPKAHMHLFAQIVLLVVGILGALIGLVLYFIGSGSSLVKAGVPLTFSDQKTQVLFFLGAGGLMGLGISLVIIWAMWKFVAKNRIRFIITLGISTITIVTGLLSVSGDTPHQALGYTFYFFMLSLGLFTGLAAIVFFFIGLSRHIVGGVLQASKS